ncbi:helix-turn-helix transcriptional regulator [Prescottella subtropica]|uniref:helix-turn-helix transcriptional regulator n=1 Tax=Prescottella subtropica TaxID=2545757 RepID=UPI0010F83925|nr:transcriptional regulator [Prescottella subtropica]
MANPNRLTTDQCLALLKELTGDDIKPMTFHSYVHRGHAPKPVEKIGRTPLWKRSEIEEWARNRPGRGTRTDLRKTRRRTQDTDTDTDTAAE